jgi:cell division protease FtsH
MDLGAQQNNKNIQTDKSPIRPKRYWFNWVYILFFIIIVLFMFNNSGSGTREISWQEFESNMLSQNEVAEIVVVNKELANIYIKEDKLDLPKYKEISKQLLSSKLNPHYKLRIGSVETFENKIEKAQQEFSLEEKIDIRYSNQADWIVIFSWIIPIVLLLFFWIIIFRGIGKSSSGGIGGTMFNFGKSTARLIDIDKRSTVTFNDVAGLKEAKVEVKEIIDFLKNPGYYTKLGAKIPKGIMLVGPPGTGKTLMAKAVAGEAKVPFFSLSGSEFVEMFVGVGASRVRDLFKRAKEKAPSIIFIDEIDAVGRSRNSLKSFQANDERENTLNQLLAELDGFGTNTGVIVLAATNRADILDKALLRAGRFDRHIYLELPNKQERVEIFNVHLRPIKTDKEVDVEILASLTPGFSGADIANICNEAALIAARKKKKKVETQDFMQARDRVVGGLERKSKIISPKEKRIVAFHEAGHAVASWYLENVDSLMKVSIIPRGKSLGAAWYLPEERQIIKKSQFIDQIGAALGGRIAEEIIFDEVSSGAMDDLEKVTKLAYNMIAFYGLNEKVGPISYYDSTGQNERLLTKPYSENMAQLIDKEVQELIGTIYDKIRDLLLEHKDELEELAELLLNKEVAEKKDLEKILGKRKEMV